MTKEQFAELEGKVKEAIGQELEQSKAEFRAGLMTEDQFKEQIESLVKSSEIDDLKTSQNEYVDTKIDELMVEVKKLQKLDRESKPKSIAEQIAEKHEALVNAKKEGKNSFILDLKTNVTTSSISGDNTGYSIPGYNAPAHRQMVFADLFRRVTLGMGDHMTVYYTDQTTTTRNAATKAEAASAPGSAIAWTRRSLELQKILDLIPLTYESMNSIEQLTEEVQKFIDLNINLEMEDQLVNGDNAAPNWYGIVSYATDFTQAIAAGLDKVDDANLADLIAKMSTYLTNGYKSKYMPDFVAVNPDDLDKVRLEKDGNGNYIKVPFMNDNLSEIRMMRVIESNLVTANSMFLGDSRHATFYEMGGVELEFGLNSDNFEKDLISLKGRKIGNLLVKTIDTGAFYKVTDIDQRIADITA